MNLRFTENVGEMIDLGRYVVAEKPNIYTEKAIGLIIKKINKMCPGITAEQREEMLFHSVYDHWAYGTNIDEEFVYKFFDCSGEGAHEYKRSYITFRTRLLYTAYLNDQTDAKLLKNKYSAYLKFKDFYKRDVISITGEKDYDIFAEFVKKHPVFVAKPEDLGRCVGVHKVDSTGCDTRELFYSLLNEGIEKKNEYTKWANTSSMVCEEIIRQSEHMSSLHPESANCIRCTTVRIGDELHHFYPRMKVGVGGEFVTGAAYGSLVVGVDFDTAKLNTDAYDESCGVYKVHPNTGVTFKGFDIPDVDGLKKTLKQLTDDIPTVRYIGWDMVHTDEGWVVMEGNDNGEFMVQMLVGRGLREEFENLIKWKPDKQFWWE